MTDAVREFQAQHSNHLGQPLAVDGIRGPQTEWAMAVARLGPRRRTAIRAACSYVGLAEKPLGSNDDPKGVIAGWLRAAGAPPKQPWCAAALSAWLELPLTKRSASAQALGRAFPACDPYAGAIMWYPTGSWQGHCGLVIGYDANSRTVMTVEGNLDNAVRVVRRDAAASGIRFSDPFEEAVWPAPVINSVPFRVTRAALGGTR